MAEQMPPQFITLQRFTTLQDHMSTILVMLQRATSPPQPMVETPPVEPTTRNDVFKSSNISTNFESIFNKKVEEVIARLKNKGRPISIKEDPFVEELMIVPLPLEFKEPTDEFDVTTDPIDHIRMFQDRLDCMGGRMLSLVKHSL
ncbi:uncharacterized protein Fot_19509 [Forsythia ovata]|uniref:Uncharacterized protein n=1 Tax=Forsythia ovata TaxID=205694 RepID=A0ABD1VMV0_9LAMI